MRRKIDILINTGHHHHTEVATELMVRVEEYLVYILL